MSCTATSVDALIKGSIIGTKDYPSTGQAYNLPDIDIDYQTPEGEIPLTGELQPWTQMDLTFGDNGSPITVAITIENRSSNRQIELILTNNLAFDNIDNTTQPSITMPITYDTPTAEPENITATPNTKIIPASTTVTYSFTLNITSPNNDCGGVFSISMQLNNYVEAGN